MPSFSLHLADTNVHNLKDLLVAAKTAPAYEFRSLLITADKDNGGAIVFVGDSDLDTTAKIFSYSLAANASRHYGPMPYPAALVDTSTLYIKASAEAYVHVEGLY